MKSNSRWKNHDVWLCLNHLPAVRYRAGQDRCWYAGCKTVRPAEDGRPEESEPAPPPPPRPRPRLRPRRPIVRPAVEAAPAAATAVAEASASAPVAPKVETPKPTAVAEAPDADEDGDDVTEAEVDFDPEEKCAWPPCAKKKRPRSKYCSRNCSNKFARWRHRQRQKAKDE